MVSSRGLLGVEFADAALEAAVRAGLDRVEALLRTTVDSHDALVAQAARHLVQAGGKRFRPLLTLLAAQFGPEHADDQVVAAAVVVELTHLATLYHDDVMDEATVRRGAQSANLRWDNTIAILTGDFLFARASGLVAGLGQDAVRIQAETFERLVTGQIRETAGPAGWDTGPIQHYLSVLADKTGSLIATAARFGALFGAADEAAVDSLRRYGELIGVAFQLSDDLLDVASTTVESGKTPGTDLREGVRTLPMLYALASDDPGGARLRELLADSLTDDGRHAEALTLLRDSPAMARARHTLSDYADRARTELVGLPDVAARRALASLADFVVARTG
ncbi:MAG: polyprenyl synthetase family protein [Actinobacteria bacterium]|nr:polyprenyl synthetase family protein [Actinomycetota bacterium]MBI3686845.1 polyprenyl synthetase family protein [Actinomycetota bacterium]